MKSWQGMIELGMRGEVGDGWFPPLKKSGNKK